MTQAIKNALNTFAYDTVKSMVEEGKHITPELLDQWETDLHGTLKENGGKIGKPRIRELLVCYILSEFDVEAFGVKSAAWKAGEVSDNAIKKLNKQRKNGFNDLKIVKAAK